MRKLLYIGSLLAAYSGLATDVSAQITVEQDNNSRTFTIGATQGRRVNDNDFESYLLGEGYGSIIRNAGISITTEGFLTFEVIGSQIANGHTNSFNIAGVPAVSFSGFNDFVSGNSTGPELIAQSYEIAQPGSVANNTFSFTNSRNNGTKTFRLNTNRFGIAVQDPGSITDLTSVYFVFDDRSRGRDYDDLVIRATFSETIASVPEPAGLGLLALCLAGIWRRQKRPASRETA